MSLDSRPAPTRCSRRAPGRWTRATPLRRTSCAPTSPGWASWSATSTSGSTGAAVGGPLRPAATPTSEEPPMAPTLFLFFFAPVSAEYLIGYDDIIGDAAALIFGLLILGPLYGAPAVLIRETSRRAGRGWPSMLLLALAFGLVQAGLI